jgi:hypothetical protein
MAGAEDVAMTDRSERNIQRLGRMESEMTATLWVLAGAVIALLFVL